MKLFDADYLSQLHELLKEHVRCFNYYGELKEPSDLFPHEIKIIWFSIGLAKIARIFDLISCRRRKFAEILITSEVHKTKCIAYADYTLKIHTIPCSIRYESMTLKSFMAVLNLKLHPINGAKKGKENVTSNNRKP